MNIKIKLHPNGKYTRELLLNKEIIRDMGVEKINIIFMSVYIDKYYKLHLLLSNKPLKTDKIIYDYRLNLTPPSPRSKQLRLRLKSLIIELFKVNGEYAYLKRCICKNKVIYELIF